MIPKIIHYAWFGSDLPQNVLKRVDSWRKIMPDWKFKLWNESNYDLSEFKFSYGMYQKGNFGFAADELRYDVLNKYGGFYLDTDMLLKKSLNDFLEYKMVWGFLYDNSISAGIIGSEPHQRLMMDILDTYAGKKNQSVYEQLMHTTTNNPIVTQIFLKEFPNFRVNGLEQKLTPGTMVYPKDYFTYISKNSNANYAEHLFDNSWGIRSQGIYGISKHVFKKIFPYTWANISAKRGIRGARRDGVPEDRE